MRTSQLNVGTSTDVSLKITESDLSLLTASIRAPSGNEEPCLLKRLPNRHIGEGGALARERGRKAASQESGRGGSARPRAPCLTTPSPQASPSPPRKLGSTW